MATKKSDSNSGAPQPPSKSKPAAKTVIKFTSLNMAAAAAAASGIPAPKPEAPRTPVAPPKTGLRFAIEQNSPFSDGYSIKGEEAALVDFLADRNRMLNINDFDQDRYIEWEERKQRLEAMQERFAKSNQAEYLVTPSESSSINTLGSLIDDEDDGDTLEIHTLEAIRMFMGRAKDPEGKSPPIVGGKRVASALRTLWDQTANDNPYADWALLRHEQTIKDVALRLKNETTLAVSALDDQKKRGLSYSVLRSSAPKTLQLGFKSPYGYAVASLISDFDYYIRVQKTLARKNLSSDDKVRQSIALVTRLIRRIFNETVRFHRWLLRDELRGLSRLDFMPTAVEKAAKRVQFATEVFGPIPADVYSGALQPRHSRRRIQITAPERQLLATVTAKLKQAADAAPTPRKQDAGAKGAAKDVSSVGKGYDAGAGVGQGDSGAGE